MALHLALILMVSISYLSPENILKFADHLFEEGDYKRAIGEYERYLFFAGEDDDRDWAVYRIGLGYEMIGEYRRALSFYKKLGGQEILYRVGCLYFKMGDFASSVDTLRKLKRAKGISERALCLEAAGLMMLGRADRARSTLRSLLNSLSREDVLGVAERLMKLMPLVESKPHKSPFLAAFLSALLPGAGKVYAGRGYDGLYSLSVVGFSAGMAYDGFRDNGVRSAKGWLFGGATLFFYLGNIYGSAIAAGEFNARENERLKEEILGSVGPLLGDFLGDFHAFKARRSSPEHGKP
ncbi:tetratricopeptide repeat protein [Candidatus Poribacteria bacterium]|nr:tetratricopeptide repeat protein [Candidatus Poribacteria bacterium]